MPTRAACLNTFCASYLFLAAVEYSRDIATYIKKGRSERLATVCVMYGRASLLPSNRRQSMRYRDERTGWQCRRWTFACLRCRPVGNRRGLHTCTHFHKSHACGRLRTQNLAFSLCVGRNRTTVQSARVYRRKVVANQSEPHRSKPRCATYEQDGI